MTSVKIKFKASVSDQGSGTLYYQIIHQRRTRIFSSGLKLRNTEWNPIQMQVVVSAGIPDKRRELLTEIQQTLRQDTDNLMAIIERLKYGYETFSADNVIEMFHRPGETEFFFPFMLRLIKDLQTSGALRTAQTHQSALHSFATFRQDKDLNLSEIDTLLVSGYETWLKRRGVTLNTVSFYMRILRSAYNKAVEQGLTKQRHPFRNVYTGVEKTVKRAVGIEVIRRLRDCDLSSKPRLAYARDLFLLSFYLRGISFVDLAFLRKQDLSEGVLNYRRRKTWQRMRIKWMPCMEEIASRYATAATGSPYLLPILDPQSPLPEHKQYHKALQQENYALRRISELLHIESLTTYVARHTWANTARRKNIPLAVICQGMGHESERTTRIYLSSLENEVVDCANDLIIGDL